MVFSFKTYFNNLCFIKNFTLTVCRRAKPKLKGLIENKTEITLTITHPLIKSASNLHNPTVSDVTDSCGLVSSLRWLHVGGVIGRLFE